MDVSHMKMLDAHHGIFCYADGGCVDDLFIYKLADLETNDGSPYFFLVINDSNREKDVAWLKNHVRGFDVEVKYVSEKTYKNSPRSVAEREATRPGLKENCLLEAHKAQCNYHGCFVTFKPISSQVCIVTIFTEMQCV